MRPDSRSPCNGIPSGACSRIPLHAACSPRSARPVGRGREFVMSDMERWLRERRVTEVECLVADLNGIARGKILPTDKFIRSHREDTLRLPEMIFVQTVTGDYPGRRPGHRPGGARRAHAPRPALAADRAVVRGAHRPGDQRLSPSRRERRGHRAPAGPAPDPRCLRRARLAPGRGARARVLPDQDQRGSRLSARAAGRPLETA